jgi:hypothetical protein
VNVNGLDAHGWWSDDDETIWLPRERYPTRNDARKFYDNQCGPFGSDYICIRVLSRHVRQGTDPDLLAEYDGQYVVECDKTEDGAIPVWRCEAPL